MVRRRTTCINYEKEDNKKEDMWGEEGDNDKRQQVGG